MEYLSTQCAAQSVGPANQLVSLLVHTLLSSYCSISNPDIWPKDYGTEALVNGLDEYDFVIIGAGSAGSVVANRLSENPKWKILLLEAGGDPPIESEVPLWFFSLQRTAADWEFYTKPNGKSCSAMNNGSCFWPRGKMLGGSSAINAMLYVRGNRKDFDTWKANGNPTWGWDDVLEYFKKSENIQSKLPLNASEHGTGGILAVDHFPGENDEITKMILDAAKEYGYNYINDFSESEGFTGYTNVLGTIMNGRRASTAKAFLISAKDRPNLHVIKHAHVKKILFDDNKSVTGVEFVYKSENHMTVKVKKEIILSAGSIGTPQILMLSGIGPEKHLKKIGFPIVHNLHVGKNLQDHAIVPLFFKSRESKPKSMSPKEILTEVYKYLMNEDSILQTVGMARLIGFVNTLDPKAPYPNIEYQHFNFLQNARELDLILTANGYNDEISNHLHKINEKAEILMTWTVLLNPKSSGKVKLASANYQDNPIIEPNYFDKKDDIETMLRGVKFQANFEHTTSFKENEAELIKLPLSSECDDLIYKSDDYWRCYMKYMSGTVYHPTGTAKMGPTTDKKAVVDPELRVYGVKGIRVADASIMPDVVSANTNAATIMIGEKLADFVKDEWKNVGKKSKKSKEHLEL